MCDLINTSSRGIGHIWMIVQTCSYITAQMVGFSPTVDVSQMFTSLLLNHRHKQTVHFKFHWCLWHGVVTYLYYSPLKALLQCSETHPDRIQFNTKDWTWGQDKARWTIPLENIFVSGVGVTFQWNVIVLTAALSGLINPSGFYILDFPEDSATNFSDWMLDANWTEMETILPISINIVLSSIFSTCWINHTPVIFYLEYVESWKNQCWSCWSYFSDVEPKKNYCQGDFWLCKEMMCSENKHLSGVRRTQQFNDLNESVLKTSAAFSGSQIRWRKRRREEDLSVCCMRPENENTWSPHAPATSASYTGFQDRTLWMLRAAKWLQKQHVQTKRLETQRHWAR